MVRMLDVLSTRVLPIGGFLYAIFLAVWDSRFHVPFGDLAMGYLFWGLRVWGRGGCG